MRKKINHNSMGAGDFFCGSSKSVKKRKKKRKYHSVLLLKLKYAQYIYLCIIWLRILDINSSRTNIIIMILIHDTVLYYDG